MMNDPQKELEAEALDALISMVFENNLNQVAQKIGIERANVTRWIKRERTPSVAMCHAILRASKGVTVSVTHSNPAGQNPVALNKCSSVSGWPMSTLQQKANDALISMIASYGHEKTARLIGTDTAQTRVWVNGVRGIGPKWGYKILHAAGIKVRDDNSIHATIAPQRRPWVNVRQLAELVNLSECTIRRYTTLPECPVIRIGKRMVFDVDEFMSWLRNDGPAKSRRKHAADLREHHGMQI